MKDERCGSSPEGLSEEGGRVGRLRFPELPERGVLQRPQR